MDLTLVRPVVDLSRRRRKWFLILAACGFSGYGAYKVYHLPSVAERRRKLAKLLRVLVSVAETFSSSAETLTIVSNDLNRFLRGDSDEIPTSLKQISKIAMSDELSGSVSRVFEALTVGIMRGVGSESSSGPKSESGESGTGIHSNFSERILDKVFSPAGAGFASIVVSSFARSLVMAFYSSQAQMSTGALGDQTAASISPLKADSPAVQEWVNLICGDKFRQLIGDCIQLFVSTAVTVYLDKTMDLNTYNEIFSGLTNPKHESEMKDIMVSVCNGAVETLIKTSHQVLTNPRSNSSTDRDEDIEQEEGLPLKRIRRISFDDENVKDSGGWVSKVSSTLAIPSNQRFVLDLTGRVTFETVRSFLDFMLWKLFDSARRCWSVVHEEIVERWFEVVRYVTAKSMFFVAVCFALCLYVLSGTRVLVSA